MGWQVDRALRTNPPSTIPGGTFETTILDVLRHRDWTDRKRAQILAAMLAEYTENIRDEGWQIQAEGEAEAHQITLGLLNAAEAKLGALRERCDVEQQWHGDRAAVPVSVLREILQ